MQTRDSRSPLIPPELLVISTLLSIGLLAPAAQSQIESTFSSRAQGLNGDIPTIKVWPGAGVNLNFIPTGEKISKVWLDDPSKVTIDFDSPLCSGDSCEPGVGATVIHLRRIQGVKFPNLMQGKNTLLSVITQDGQGQRKLNQFRLVMASGSPEYSAFQIYPDTKETPTLQVRDRIVPLTTVEIGMRDAESDFLLNPSLKAKLLNFMALAQNGVPVTVAAQQAGVSMALVTKLAQMGQQNQDLLRTNSMSPANLDRNP